MCVSSGRGKVRPSVVTSLCTEEYGASEASNLCEDRAWTLALAEAAVTKPPPPSSDHKWCPRDGYLTTQLAISENYHLSQPMQYLLPFCLLSIKVKINKHFEDSCELLRFDADKLLHFQSCFCS